MEVDCIDKVPENAPVTYTFLCSSTATALPVAESLFAEVQSLHDHHSHIGSVDGFLHCATKKDLLAQLEPDVEQGEPKQYPVTTATSLSGTAIPLA
jgi:hypothetical protein